MAWSFDDCAGNSAGTFAITVIGSPDDVGPNELAVSESGTDHYPDSGTFSLGVDSGACNWTATVAGSPSTTTATTAPPLSNSPITFTSTQTGSSGETKGFNATGPWTLAWSFSHCAGGMAGNFAVPINGSSSDAGPNELEVSGQGSDRYTDSRLITLGVDSDACAWTMTVTGSSPSPTSATRDPVRTMAEIFTNSSGDNGGSSGSTMTTAGTSLALTGAGAGDFWLLATGVVLFVIGLIGKRSVARFSDGLKRNSGTR